MGRLDAACATAESARTARVAALCEAASVVVTDYDAFSVAAAARAAAHNCALNPAVAALGRVRAERLDWKDACTVRLRVRVRG